MWKPLVVSLLIALLAAACGPTDSAPPAPTLAPTAEPAPTQEIGDGVEIAETEEVDLNLGQGGDGLFTATLTGSVETTVAGAGSYDCDGGANVLSVASGESSLRFTLPSDIAAGEYSIGTGDNELASALQVEGQAYDSDVFGILTLTLVPGAAGDPVSGSFDMNYSDGASSVNAVGQFDLTAAGVC